MSPAPGNVERLDDIGLSVDRVTWHWFHKVRPDGQGSTPGAAQSTNTQFQTGPGENIARPQRTWHKGSGYTEQDADFPEGTIGYGWPADTRRKRTIMPPPKLEEIPISGAVDNAITSGTWRDSFELEWVTQPGLRAAGDLFAMVGSYVVRLDTPIVIPPAPQAVVDVYFPPGSNVDFLPLSAEKFGGPVWLGGIQGASSAQQMWRRDTTGWVPTSNAVNRWYLSSAKVVIGENFAGDSGKAGEERVIMFGSMPGVGAIKWNLDDPFNPAKWYPGTAETIGVENVQITGMISSRAAVAFLSTLGVFIHDGTTCRWLTPSWRDDHDVGANGRTGLFYRGGVLAAHRSFVDWVPYGQNVAHAPRKVQPGAPPIPNNSPVQGTVTAMTTAEGEPCAAVYMAELNQTAICLGFPAELIGAEGSTHPLIWHFAHQIIPGRVDHMCVSSLTPGPPGTPTQPYLHCFATNGPGVNALDTQVKARWFRMRLAKGGNPLQDPTYPFATEWTAYLTEDEVADGIMVTTRRNQATSQGGDFAEFSVSADGSAYVAQGHVSSPGSDWTADTQVSGRRMRWKIEAHGWEDDPFILRSFTPNYILTPDEIERDVHQVVIERRMESLNTTVRDIDIETEEQFLRSLATEGAIYYIDPTGQEWVAKYVPGSQRLLVEIRDNEWGVVRTFSLDKFAPVRYVERGGVRSDDGGVI